MKMDGVKEEAPRCLKPMHTTVYLFKELTLDALIHGINASGLLEDE